AEIPATDLIFVPGLWRSPRRTVSRLSILSSWLADRHAQGSTLCSIGTGSYLLADAGLLDHLPATTHWYYFDDFHNNYPLVKLQRGRFITLADRLYCTGSVNAARDVILHLVEHLFDAAIASEVSRHFTHELKRSYESMLLEEQQQDTHHDELIIQVQEWLQLNYQNAVQLHDVAERFKLSVRSLNRRFRQAANNAPLQYLQEIRVEHAKELLKKSNLGIAEICYRIGYHDNSYFTSLFKKMNGVTPSQYRSLVRSKLFTVDETQA
ncbi:MAG: helix-turn-helix domain-containing protein, partial [Pseudohongiellaceae bacterium]